MNKTKPDAASRIKKLNKETEKRNKKFAKMTREQKRVAIAKEVIHMFSLKNKKFKAETSTGYVIPRRVADRKYFISPKEAKQDVDFQQVLPRLKECTVCGIGAMFLASVRIGDNCKVNQIQLSAGDTAGIPDDGLRHYEAIDGLDLASRQSIVSYLAGIFDQSEIEDIETTFEGTWHHQGLPASRVLKIIMQTIVDSNGEPYSRQRAVAMITAHVRQLREAKKKKNVKGQDEESE